ncbi:flagellar assembly protein FliH [Crenobacter sp. SG2303]|uniref:Flagellar assembly protein FliH n=1 Tax=Crenobacter oryzisoli TaxID=3056844 RepID=A0ABT7XK60_9NEIS|nr:flagellar assembly protein FliH [Crenobacter sp. SG2303]MDN0074177.1 flagellar assembly protein FliH [Crenobacter sp. SG2303]
MKASSNNTILNGATLPESAWSPWRFADLGEQPTLPATPAPVGEEVPAGEPSVVEDVQAVEMIEEMAEPALNYPTAAELEAIHQEAWQAGYEAGHQAGLTAGQEAGEAVGHEAGMTAVRKQFAEAWEPLARLTESFEEEIARIEPVLASDVLQLALMLAGKLVGNEIATNPTVLEPLLRDALLALPPSLKAARLRVNPADLAVVRRFLEREAPQTVWQWVEDPLLERGGCLIDSDGARLDLTLARRREALAASLGLTSLESVNERVD